MEILFLTKKKKKRKKKERKKKSSEDQFSDQFVKSVFSRKSAEMYIPRAI